MIAWLNLRHTVPERTRAFQQGLRRMGYVVESGTTGRPRPKDILVTWNRIGAGRIAAESFESRGNTVLVAENATWGNGFLGRQWYTIARNWHNTSGRFPAADGFRWDRLGVGLPEFRTEGETVILPQRGIGQPPVSMPLDWPQRAHKVHGGRIRAHPGQGQATLLEADLSRCGKVVTWGSGAAIKALMLGIPVVSEMPNWIGEQDNTELGRLEMFRRLAWAQWELGEIASGEPFARLIA